jgi:hypothetical protein
MFSTADEQATSIHAIVCFYGLSLRDAMPRFYLHIRCKDGGMSYDEFGLDYPDVETALSAAAWAAQDLKHVFAALLGQGLRGYAIEVENDAGEMVFRLPFSENLRPSLPHSPATYRIVASNGLWLIYCDDELVGGFVEQPLAELFVWELVETRCARQMASQVLIEDELVCEKHLYRCFKEAPPGTLLS